MTAFKKKSWTVNKDIAKWLAAFEIKVLRSLLGGITVMKTGERNRIKNYFSFLEV
jgi:hypothetical protein